MRVIPHYLSFSFFFITRFHSSSLRVFFFSRFLDVALSILLIDQFIKATNNANAGLYKPDYKDYEFNLTVYIFLFYHVDTW